MKQAESTLQIELPGFLAQANAVAQVMASAQARMRFVIDLARRNIAAQGGPFAAAVFELDSGRLVAAGANRVVATGLSCAHAEMIALSLAQRRLGCFDLGGPGMVGCELVCNAEPCLMCLGAVLWSGVRRLTCGARSEDVAAIGFDEGPRPADWLGELDRRRIVVCRDVLREEANEVLREYRALGGPIYNGRGAA